MLVAPFLLDGKTGESFQTEKLHLILHLKLHLTGSLGAVNGQCVALDK